MAFKRRGRYRGKGRKGKFKGKRRYRSYGADRGGYRL